MARGRRCTETIDAFRDYRPPEPVAARLDPEIVKGATLDVRISKLVGHALAACGRSRAEIAAEMSDYLGCYIDNHGRRPNGAVTENMLDQYASPARRDQKITLERFIALVEVTGCRDLLDFVCAPSGHVAVPAQYEAVLRKHQLQEFREKIDREERAIDAELRGWR